MSLNMPLNDQPVPSPRLSTGEEDGSGEAGESDMDGHSESRHPAIGPEDWDGPSKFTSFLSLSGGYHLIVRQLSDIPQPESHISTRK